jgi:hypothetical protein
MDYLGDVVTGQTLLLLNELRVAKTRSRKKYYAARDKNQGPASHEKITTVCTSIGFPVPLLELTQLNRETL